MRAPLRTTIVFPHIPKTGGTTLLYHFRQNYGDDSVFIHGPHARVKRFFQHQKQYEEIGQDAISLQRVIQGHGVDQTLLAGDHARQFRLLVVLRHPVSLTRSRFAHSAGILSRRGEALSTDRFLSRDQGNVLCTLLVKKFPSLIEDPAARLADQAKSVLKHFHYVYTTEQIDRQVRPMMAHLGLPQEMERRRVTERERAVLDVEDDAILTRNAEDLLLFEACNHVQRTDGTWHNPLLDEHRDVRNAVGSIEPLDNSVVTYEGLARALCGELLMDTALEWVLNREDLPPPNVGDLPRLVEEFQAMNSMHARKLSASAKATSLEKLTSWNARKPRR